MIGKNIKSLRKTRDLTQPEFARIIGISRNSLSRYENGTSSVSTELIDIICQKFNVSYVDIVGEDKMLNPVEDYELTLKIEIVKERGANLLSRLYRYQDSQGISIDGESNPWILMSDDLSDLIHTNIYLVETFNELKRYSGYLDGIDKQVLARNLRSLTRGKKSSKQPIAILLGGQSGAGKTTIHRIKQKEFQGNIVIIDGDSFRSQHPHYLELQQEYGKDSVEYTKDFAGKMVESLVTELSHLGYNLLIEGTLRTIDVPKETAQLLKSKGYEVQLALIATKPKLSYLSTLIRYEELYAINPNQARATPKEHHDFIVNHLVDNTRQLEELAIFERIQIYQRDRSCVYDSGEDKISAAKVLQEYLFGKWSKVEEEMLKVGEERLREMSKSNGNDV